MVMFLNRQDRNRSCMKEEGYEYREVKSPLDGAVKESSVTTTIDGFHPPKEMKPRRSYGIFCTLFGTSPENRVLDIRLSMDHLAKDVYESEMDILAANARLAEYKTLLHFAREDEAKTPEQTEDGCSQDGENQKADGENQKGSRREDKKRRHRAKVELSAGQETVRNAITWRYNWIQAYKKDCYLFAQYKAEELLSDRQAEKYLEAFSPEVRTELCSFAERYDPASGEPDAEVCEKIGICADKMKTFCRLARQAREQEAFCADFIQMASELPEPNRRLLDRMYETAWRLYFRFALGVEPEQIPAPWYDTPEATPEDTPEATPEDTPEQDSTAQRKGEETAECEEDMEYWG